MSDAVHIAGTATHAERIQGALGTMFMDTTCSNCGSKKPEPKPAGDSWQCACGATATGKFCPECGKPKPAAAAATREPDDAPMGRRVGRRRPWRAAARFANARQVLCAKKKPGRDGPAHDARGMPQPALSR